MHKAIPELKDQYEKGKMTRREFIRTATLLGLSMGGIQAFLASSAPTPTPTELPAGARV